MGCCELGPFLTKLVCELHAWGRHGRCVVQESAVAWRRVRHCRRARLRQSVPLPDWAPPRLGTPRLGGGSPWLGCGAPPARHQPCIVGVCAGALRGRPLARVDSDGCGAGAAERDHTVGLEAEPLNLVGHQACGATQRGGSTLQPREHGERVVRRRDDGAREVEGQVGAVEGRALEEDGGEARVSVGSELLLALSDQALLRVRVRLRGQG